MDAEEEAKRQKRRENRDFALGGTFGALAMTSLFCGFMGIKEAFSDPLSDAVQKSTRPLRARVQLDRLADEISKDPEKQARWKELREFVATIDDQVGKNLEQAAGGIASDSQSIARHGEAMERSRRRGKEHEGLGRRDCYRGQYHVRRHDASKCRIV